MEDNNGPKKENGTGKEFFKNRDYFLFFSGALNT